MKSKLISFLSAAALISALTFSVASAEGVGSNGVNAGVKADVDVELNAQGDDNTSATVRGNATSSRAQETERGNATSTEAKDDRGNATSTDAEESGQLTAESHRSTVAIFVQKLLDVADREGGIGDEVRVIAKAQSDTASTSAEAITKVEDRGTLQTILFGSDDKNLGVLRSDIATTVNSINKLTNLLGRTTNAADKAELTAQIKVLENSQAQLNAFVKAHESSFSLFGWFTRMFSR